MLTWVEISRSALDHNIRAFKKLVGKRAGIMPIVKSNAYGHGVDAVAPICDAHKDVQALGVASLEEAVHLLDIGIAKPVVILSFFEISVAQKLPADAFSQLRFPIYCFTMLSEFNHMLKKRGLRARVHIKIDTGAARVGFMPHEIPRLVRMCSGMKHIIVESIFTHFADSEHNDEFTRAQHEAFARIELLFLRAGYASIAAHSACTAASVRLLKSHADMIRLGIGLYGLSPHPSISAKLKQKTGASLIPALEWKTRLIQTKTITRGTTVGYGRTFTAPRTMPIGIMPVGYYDGYDRAFSNNGAALVRNAICKVIGRVCMNLTMLGIPRTAAQGDAVTLISASHAEVSADRLSERAHTINYEIVTRINPLIPRILVA